VPPQLLAVVGVAADTFATGQWPRVTAVGADAVQLTVQLASDKLSSAVRWVILPAGQAFNHATESWTPHGIPACGSFAVLRGGFYHMPQRSTGLTRSSMLPETCCEERETGWLSLLFPERTSKPSRPSRTQVPSSVPHGLRCKVHACERKTPSASFVQPFAPPPLPQTTDTSPPGGCRRHHGDA
jgi:hypothetical protein